MENNEKISRSIDDVLKDENIVSCEDFHDSVDFVFSKMADSIGKTLGPGGAFTIITNTNSSSPVYPTKDGFTVAQEYKFNDQIKFFIAEIIKDITRRMNNKVGDSTTSGVLIAYNLYKCLRTYDITKLYPEIGCILPPISIRAILEAINKTLISKLYENPNYILRNIDRELENSYMKKIATVSANNDSEIGNLVADLFINRSTDHVSITTEMGIDDETVVEKEVGFEFGSGFINPIMCNQVDRISCKFTKPKFFLVDGALTLNDMNTLERVIDYVILDLKQPIVLIAKDYDQPVLNMLIKRCTPGAELKGGVYVNKPKEPIAALTVNTEHEKSKDRFEDLRLLLDCEVVETKKGKIMEFKSNVDFINRFLGEAEEFSGTQLRSRIKRGRGDKSVIIERIKHLEERIKQIDLNNGILAFTSVDNLRKRISMMNSDMTIIRVGGVSDKDRRVKKLIFDDAVGACLSAMKSGIAIGGNVGVVHYITKFKETLINEITTYLIDNSKHIVVGNKYEDVSKIVADILEFVKESFKSAYTIAIKNMVGDGKGKDYIIDQVYGSDSTSYDKPKIYNLVRNVLVDITDEHTIPVPANTDIELMNSIFAAVGTFISSNQLLSVFPGQTLAYVHDKK